MAEENEIQIVLTAIDNASDTIDRVSNSLGGADGSSGLSKTASAASETVDELAGSFKGMTVEQLSYISTLGMSKEKQEKYNAALDAAVAKSKGVTAATKSSTLSIAGMTITTGAAVTAFAALAVAVGLAASAYIVFSSANKYSNEVLANTADYTEENIALAREYRAHIDEIDRSVNRLTQAVLAGKNSWGEYWTEVANGVFNYIESIGGSLSGFNFPTLGGVEPQGYQPQFDYNQLQEATGGFAGGDYYDRLKESAEAAQRAVDNLAAAETKRLTAGIGLVFSYQATFEQLADKEEELAAALAAGWSETSSKVLGIKGDIAELEGQIDKTTNKFILDMYQMQLAADGVFDEGDMARYLNMALSMGIIGQAAYDAAIETLGLKDAIDALKDKTITITVITDHEGGGGGEGDSDHQLMASGGTLHVGQKALVGDKPGGIPTPWSEIIEALPGGGVRVYPNSQTSAMRNMPSFAEGGTFGSDLTGDLSRMIRDLPNAIALAIETTMQRSVR